MTDRTGRSIEGITSTQSWPEVPDVDGNDTIVSLADGGDVGEAEDKS